MIYCIECLLKSMNTPTVTFLLSILPVNFSTNSINANEVDLLFRKLYCESVNIDSFQQMHVMFCQIIFLKFWRIVVRRKQVYDY